MNLNNFKQQLATILNINTAFETASVFFSADEKIITEAQSDSQKDHASFLEPAIKKICDAAQFDLSNINAVSVINGPGSYTGLRAALASAKAFCYALQKPLILLNTLDVMAYALKLQSFTEDRNVLYCPLIDARRMEVFTAFYDYNLHIIKNYTAEILDPQFLSAEKKIYTIIAGGSGSFKMQQLLNDENMVYITPLNLSKPAAILSAKAFSAGNFSNIAYCEPFYLKPVYFKKPAT